MLCPYFALFVALRDESLKQNLWLKKSMIEIRNSCFLDERRQRRRREEAEEKKRINFPVPREKWVNGRDRYVVVTFWSLSSSRLCNEARPIDQQRTDKISKIIRLKFDMKLGMKFLHFGYRWWISVLLWEARFFLVSHYTHILELIMDTLAGNSMNESPHEAHWEIRSRLDKYKKSEE